MGEVKIGEETVNSFELVGRINKGGGGPEMGAEVGGGLQDANRGGSHGNDPSSRGNLFFDFRADFIPLRVHRVVTEIGGFDRAESAEANMEGNKGVVELR